MSTNRPRTFTAKITLYVREFEADNRIDAGAYIGNMASKMFPLDVVEKIAHIETSVEETTLNAEYEAELARLPKHAEFLDSLFDFGGKKR